MSQLSPKTLFFLGLAIIVAKGYASNAPAAPTYPSGRSTRLPPPGRLVALVVVFTIAGLLPENIGVPLDVLILAALALAPGGIVLPSFEGFAPSTGTTSPGGLPPATQAQMNAIPVTPNLPSGAPNIGAGFVQTPIR